jgi:uncharacterized membrane protein
MGTGTEQSITVEIDAPADRVWAVLTDAERWPEWTASVRRVSLVDDALRVGARATIEQPRLPQTVWTVTHLDEGREFVWEAKAPGARTVARHTVEQVGPGRTRVRLSVSQSGWLGWVMGRVYRTLTDRYLAMEAAGLKARAESGD